MSDSHKVSSDHDQQKMDSRVRESDSFIFLPNNLTAYNLIAYFLIALIIKPLCKY